jgi:Fur family ferric uptake transcriptional regulator
MVLKVIAGSHEHLTPASVYEKVQQEHQSIGQVTVYRTLEILAALGLICRVPVGGRSCSYKVAPSEHHHHLICSNCGTVVDFAGCDLDDLEKKLSQRTGFNIESHLLEFLGCCQSCQNVVPV